MVISEEQQLSHEGNSVSDNDSAPWTLSVILTAPLWKQGENWPQDPPKYSVSTMCIGSVDRNSHQAECLDLFMGSVVNSTVWLFCSLKKQYNTSVICERNHIFIYLNFPLSDYMSTSIHKKLQRALMKYVILEVNTILKYL